MARPAFRLLCAALALLATPLTAQHAADAELLDLNARLFHSMIVERDTTLFAELAVEEFQVLAPGGLIEDRGQAIRGVGGWDAVSAEVTGAEVRHRGPVAWVTGRLDIDGTMNPVGRWGPLKFVRVFLREDDRWRLIAQSLTPCLDLLVQRGMC